MKDEVSADMLSRLFGCDVRTIGNLAKEGMPKSTRGRFSLRACVPWYLDRERQAARANRGLNDLDLARQRKTIAEARKAEIELAQTEAAVLPTDMHEQRLRERLETVAGSVKAIGRYHADVKAAVTDEDADALLDRMSEEILAELHGLKDTIE